MRVNSRMDNTMNWTQQRSLRRVVVVAALGVLVIGRSAMAAVCSSLSGPFCTGVSSDFAVPPAHAHTSLDRDEQHIREADLAKKLKVEHVLKEYEMAQTQQLQDTEERLLNELNDLLDETMALLNGLREEEEKESPVVGSFAFSSEGDTYDLLETMDGQEMKDFFLLAYDEVVRTWEATLEGWSPEIAQGVREAVEQLRNLADYQTYEFRYLDENAQDKMRTRFENHRLIEVQRTFEKLIIATNTHERQIAYEAVIYLFQLAQEEDDLLSDEQQVEQHEETIQDPENRHM